MRSFFLLSADRGREPSARCQKKRRRSGERIAVVMSRFFRQTDWNVLKNQLEEKREWLSFCGGGIPNTSFGR